MEDGYNPARTACYGEAAPVRMSLPWGMDTLSGWPAGHITDAGSEVQQKRVTHLIPRNCHQ